MPSDADSAQTATNRVLIMRKTRRIFVSCIQKLGKNCADTNNPVETQSTRMFGYRLVRFFLKYLREPQIFKESTRSTCRGSNSQTNSIRPRPFELHEKHCLRIREDIVRHCDFGKCIDTFVVCISASSNKVTHRSST